jgi:hypothetical protein
MPKEYECMYVEQNTKDDYSTTTIDELVKRIECWPAPREKELLGVDAVLSIKRDVEKLVELTVKALVDQRYTDEMSDCPIEAALAQLVGFWDMQGLIKSVFMSEHECQRLYEEAQL